MVLKVSEHTTDILTAPHKFRIYAYLGDAHYYLGNYRLAESSYKSALAFKDACSIMKTPLKHFDGMKDPMPDIGECLSRYDANCRRRFIGTSQRPASFLDRLPDRTLVNQRVHKKKKSNRDGNSTLLCYDFKYASND